MSLHILSLSDVDAGARSRKSEISGENQEFEIRINADLVTFFRNHISAYSVPMHYSHARSGFRTSHPCRQKRYREKYCDNRR